MSRTRIHNFSISLDGFATGEGQSLETPFGHAGHRLHEWMFATRFGAEIMGAGKFGPPGWQDDAEWQGWWGPNPPFHTRTGYSSSEMSSSSAGAVWKSPSHRSHVSTRPIARSHVSAMVSPRAFQALRPSLPW